MVDIIRSKKGSEKQQNADPHYADRLLVDDDGAAWLLTISVRSLWRGVSSGCIIAPEKIGGLTRWNRKKLEAWVDEGCPPVGQGNNG